MSTNPFLNHRNSSAVIESEDTSSSSSAESLDESEVVVVNPVLEDTVDELNTGISITFQDTSMLSLDGNMGEPNQTNLNDFNNLNNQESAMADDEPSMIMSGSAKQEAELLGATGGTTSNPTEVEADKDAVSFNLGKYYPERDECTEDDAKIFANLRWPMSDPTPTSKRQIQKLDFKYEGRRSMFRSINDNPVDLGYDEKNLSDLLINPLTLAKACRVGCKEKEIDDLFKKVDKTIQQADSLTDAARKALQAADECKQSLIDCKKIIKDHVTQSDVKYNLLKDRVVNLERASNPADVVKDFVAKEAKAVGELVANNTVIQTLRKEHAKNTVTICSNQKKINTMVDRRSKERLNCFELRILEFNPSPEIHDFKGDFLKAGETKYKEIVNKILKEVWENYDIDDTRSVRAYKCLEPKVGAGNQSWQPYRFTVLFDTASAADKIYARARLLKNDNGGFKHVIVRPKTGDQLDRDRDLKEQMLSKNLRRAPDEQDQSYVIVRLRDGSRGLILKKNQDLQPWQIFNAEDHNLIAKNKAVQWGIEEDKKMKQIEAHVAHYQLGQL